MERAGGFVAQISPWSELPFPRSDLSCDPRDGCAEHGEAVQDGDADLELCDLTIVASALGIASDALAAERGIETKIIAGETAAPDRVLQQSLAEAHAWARDLRAGSSLTAIARKTGRSEPYIRTRIPLAFLPPRIQIAILDGRQPPDLSVVQLLREGIPMDWREPTKLFAVG